MIFSNRHLFTALAVMTLVAILTSCEKDPTTIGSTIVGGEPFATDRATYNVFAKNRKIKAVRTNQLPLYQLGRYTDPVYGSTQATITSQVTLSAYNPTFGDMTATREIDSARSENETVTSVFLYIPFLTNNVDADGDGLIAGFDINDSDPNSDSDKDGLSDNQERVRGSDPLDASDASNENFVRDQFVNKVNVDSIYGDREQAFNLSVERSTYFLRDLDPNTNFQEAQEYFSDQDFSSFVTGAPLFNGEVSVVEEEILIDRLDNLNTANVDESETQGKVGAGIRVELDAAFFQENILDKEGSTELSTQANFTEFLRGIRLSITPVAGKDMMVLFDLTMADITINYNYLDNDEETKRRELKLNFITRAAVTNQNPNPAVVGNAVNSFMSDTYPTEISEAIASEENANRIYIKGGAGSFAEINLFDDANGTSIIQQIKANNWIINEANLVFHVDGQPGVVQPPRLYLYDLETGGSLIAATDIAGDRDTSTLNRFPFYDGVLTGDVQTGTDSKYTIKITDYINNLVIRNADNGTLGLTITPDISLFNTQQAMLEDATQAILPLAATLSPLGTVLFGSQVSAENAAKQLKLELFYTEAN